MKPLLTLIVAATLLAGCSNGKSTTPATVWTITITDKNGPVEEYTASDYLIGDNYVILYDNNGHKKAEITGSDLKVKTKAVR